MSIKAAKRDLDSYFHQLKVVLHEFPPGITNPQFEFTREDICGLYVQPNLDDRLGSPDICYIIFVAFLSSLPQGITSEHQSSKRNTR